MIELWIMVSDLIRLEGLKRVKEEICLRGGASHHILMKDKHFFFWIISSDESFTVSLNKTSNCVKEIWSILTMFSLTAHLSITKKKKKNYNIKNGNYLDYAAFFSQWEETINTLRQNHPFLTASLFIFILNHYILSTTQKNLNATPKNKKSK